MHVNFAAVRGVLDLGVGFDLSRRQMSERGKIFVPGSGGVGVIGVFPIKRGKCAWNPVEIVTYDAAS